VFKEFGPDPQMQLYQRGIRRRLAPMLAGDRRRIELAYSLMFTLPGTPVIRYGDELGMGDDLALLERNCARTPMQWSNEPNAGFTKSARPVTPVISSGAYGYEHVNAAQQRREPNSLLNWTERLIRMRKEVPEIGWGDFELLATGTDCVFAIRYDWRNNSVVFVHNLEGTPREVSFDVGLPGEIEFGMGRAQDGAIFARQPAHDRRADHAAMAGDPDALAGKLEHLSHFGRNAGLRL